MKIVTLKVSVPYDPLTHGATREDPDATPDVVYALGGRRRKLYEKSVLEARDKMSAELSEYDDTFIKSLNYNEIGDEDILRDTAQYIIKSVIMVKTWL